MNKIDFKLPIEEEYITLTKLLKTCNLIGSGGEVKIHLDNDDILYNQEIEYRKRKKCYLRDKIVFCGHTTITII